MGFDEDLLRGAKEHFASQNIRFTQPGARGLALAAMENWPKSIRVPEDDWNGFVEAVFAFEEKSKQAQGSTPSTSSTPPTSEKAKGRPAVRQEQLTSPYRFVTLNERVVHAERAVERMSADTPLPGGFSGSIHYTLVAESPILIGTPDPEDEAVSAPMRLGRNGPWVLPGATMRGLLRSVSEIVAYARLTPINKHHRYGLRDFFHPDFAGDGNSESRRTSLNALRAGFLRPARDGDPEKRDGDSDYVIEPCDLKLIRIRDMYDTFGTTDDSSEGVFHARWLQRGLRGRYSAYEVGQDDDDNPLFDFTARHRFSQSANHASDLEPDEDGDHAGIFVFSDVSPSANSRNYRENLDRLVTDLDAQDSKTTTNLHKKRECVFLEHETPDIYRVRQDRFDAFRIINSRPGKNDWQPDGVWAVLAPTLAVGRRIPVFYTGDPRAQAAGFELGLTRVFKIGHRYSVADKVAKHPDHVLRHADFRPDMVEALFGYVYEGADFVDGTRNTKTLQRKGRVAFGFAMLDNPQDAIIDEEEVRTVAMAPRASFAPFYLQGQYKDWSSDSAKLAGRKRYFPRFRVADTNQPQTVRDKVTATLNARRVADNTDLLSRLKFLRPRGANRLRFSGEIRLTNVTAAEIGMLLWALTHGGDPRKPCRHMIGRAKTAGAGQMRVVRIKLALHGNDGAAGEKLEAPKGWELKDEKLEGWLEPGSASMTPFLNAFHNHMTATARGWLDDLPVKDFLTLSAPIASHQLAAEYLDGPKEHMELRATAKLDTHKDWEEPDRARPRYLTAQHLTGLTFPYQD